MHEVLVLAPTQLGWPRLEGIIEAPALRPDGTVISEPGYDPSTGLFYAPNSGLIVPPIPAEPTRKDLRAAVAQIADLLTDFPFVDASSKANAIATIITPIARPAITGPVPLALFDAPSPGTGKTLLAEILYLILTGRPAPLFSAPAESGEWRKTLTSALRESPPVVVIDEVCERLASGQLCKALTAELWADRTLGHNRVVQLPVRCAWIATGNNLQVGGDMPRRCYWVRMDAKCAEPWKRAQFKYSDVKTHVLAHRGELLGALLTVAQGWIAAGAPRPRMQPLGSYENWTTVVGGMLETAEIEGFLANTDTSNAEADTESAQWEVFLLALHDVFGDKPFTVAEVLRECKADGSRLRQFLPGLRCRGDCRR